MEQKITEPAYRKIAVEIARDIARGKYSENQRLSGRTVLASHYEVSPETIRKAVHILKDVGILDTERGSGIEIISLEKAKEFSARHSQIEKIVSAQRDIIKWSQRQAEEFKDITEKIRFIVNTAEKLKVIDPLAPYEIEIKADSPSINKSIEEICFWQNTGATVIAIRRGDILIVSPGPYAIVTEKDIFYVVGNDQAYCSALKLLVKA